MFLLSIKHYYHYPHIPTSPIISPHLVSKQLPSRFCQCASCVRGIKPNGRVKYVQLSPTAASINVRDDAQQPGQDPNFSVSPTR